MTQRHIILMLAHLMNAIILSVGDELVLGQTIDTNSAWISQQLASVGCDILAHMTVPDNQQAIKRAIAYSIRRADVLIISGGLGPTEDDLTRQALAAVMNVPLELNEEWLARLEEFFARLNRPMPQSNRIQAMIPRGAKTIENTCGTAAGIRASVPRSASSDLGMPPLGQFQGRPIGRVLTKMGRVTRDQVIEALTIQKSKGGPLGQIFISLGYITENDLDFALAAQKGQTFGDSLQERREQMFGQPDNPQSQIQDPKCEIFVMPGVPKEMKAMFLRDVLPHVATAAGGAVILSTTLHTFGLGESSVAERLGTLMMRQQNPSVGTTVSNGIVSLRINARAASHDQAQRELEATIAQCRDALGDIIFGAGDETLQGIVAALLASSHETVCTAESFTGGLLAKMLTDIPGSSDYFTQGWVTYSNRAKTERLGVSENLINVHGAVSEPVAESMARNSRRLAKADFALSISGIAGPGGGTPAKPVGTVCIALAWQKDPSSRGEDRYRDSEVHVRTFHFTGDREMVRDRSAKMALSLLRYRMLGKALPF